MLALCDTQLAGAAKAGNSPELWTMWLWPARQRNQRYDLQLLCCLR